MVEVAVAVAVAGPPPWPPRWDTARAKHPDFNVEAVSVPSLYLLRWGTTRAKHPDFNVGVGIPYGVRPLFISRELLEQQQLPRTFIIEYNENK